MNELDRTDREEEMILAMVDGEKSERESRRDGLMSYV